MNIQKLLKTAFLSLALAMGAAHAGTPQTGNDGITTIHMDQYRGYFAVEETLAGLKPGKYRFVVTNKADKVVGFLLQDGTTHDQLDVFPLDPGQTRETVVTLNENGFRYRCPINPTPWHDVAIEK